MAGMPVSGTFIGTASAIFPGALPLIECAEAVPCRTSQTISVAGSESVGTSNSPEELRVSLVVGGLVSEVGLLQLDGLLH